MVRIKKNTFNQIVKQYTNDRTGQTKRLVWNYINSMQKIYFVQCGRRECPVPWIMFEEDIPVAMLFTDCDQAIQAANSCIEDCGNLRVVGLPTNAASMYVTAIAAQGVEHVCFNHGPNRFDATMEEVLISLGSMSR
ncbi:MAG: hypothetical protein QF718_01990 [Phycisphaerales bacterium]|jgi:hypothetical protein|nr:hypothetical protein [Phycisphaerales bacterium]